MPRPDPISRLQLALFLPALLSAGVTLTVRFDPIKTDFGCFYYTALAHRQHLDPALVVPALPSLSPPTLSLLIWPLTFLPLPVAFALWSAFSALGIVGIARVLMRRGLILSDRSIAWFVLATLGLAPVLSLWIYGQLAWLLGYLIARAWDSSSPWRAGAWLALGIAVKPPLALMALALPFTIGLSAGLIAGTVTLAAVAIMGLDPWRQWLALKGAVTWLDSPGNLSIFGMAARLPGDHPTIAALHPVAVAAALALIALLYVVCWRATGDRRWTLAGLFYIYASPIGWLHYLPSLMAVLIRTWPRNRWMTAALVLFACPIPLQIALVLAGGIGRWIYPLAGWCLLLAYLSTSTRRALRAARLVGWPAEARRRSGLRRSHPSAPASPSAPRGGDIRSLVT